MSEETQHSPLIDLESREGADSDYGSNGTLAWGSRSDVGLIRDHNEDSFLCRPPLFAVSDGMGGHAAGEVASSIAIHTLAKNAPEGADAATLAAALEKANHAVIEAPESGRGREGMGCTLTTCIIENNKLACAHVGDSRMYLVHNNMVVRVTHDHSYVEELVDAGAITADEARVHPKRSVITRALGSDRDMYADHFTINVEVGERIVLCSDGLSSMISDAELEQICLSHKQPQACADALVSAALVAGGSDNVTVVVIDVLDDGTRAKKRKQLKKTAAIWSGVVAGLLALVAGVFGILYTNSYFVAPAGDKVGIYQGFFDSFDDIDLNHLVDTTDLAVSDLTPDVKARVENGVYVASVDEAKETVNAMREQVDDRHAADQQLQEDNGEVDIDLNDDPGDTLAATPARPDNTGGDNQ